MREIQFRAWDKRTKEMYDVIEIGWRDDFGMRIGFLKNPYWGSRPRTQEEVDLMQYTGLADKNGNEIYEADVIDFDGELFTILFKQGMFCIEDEGFFPIADFYSIVTVIGNVYENPELI